MPSEIYSKPIRPRNYWVMAFDYEGRKLFVSPRDPHSNLHKLVDQAHDALLFPDDVAVSAFINKYDIFIRPFGVKEAFQIEITEIKRVSMKRVYMATNHTVSDFLSDISVRELNSAQDKKLANGSHPNDLWRFFKTETGAKNYIKRKILAAAKKSIKGIKTTHNINRNIVFRDESSSPHG